MTRKDVIFEGFLSHEFFKEKYKIKNEELPKNLKEGLRSKNSMVKAIAIIVDDAESNNPSSEKSLFTKITQFLKIQI